MGAQGLKAFRFWGSLLSCGSQGVGRQRIQIPLCSGASRRLDSVLSARVSGMSDATFFGG